MIKRFTLYGSPHSLPTYKVALMLRLAGEPFSFRYVSFQKGMHKTPEFLALSRWGQVPVLVDSERVYLQSAAIVKHLAKKLGRFQGADPMTRQAVRECCTGTSMSCFHGSSTAMAFNSVSVGFYRSMSSRRLLTTTADVPRWRYRCWTPNFLIATISAVQRQLLRIYSATATWPLPNSARSTCIAGQTWSVGPKE